MIIAIDGPAGCGKSTVAKTLAKRLGFYFLNTGSFYRAITYAHILKGGDCSDKPAVLETARNTHITVENGDICIDGQDVESKLHCPEVDLNASYVSSDPAVREIVTARVREIAGAMDIVTEGRDTTTVIFPDAEGKFYFDASAEIRARRRFEQGEGDLSYEEILAQIIKRDENDRNKAVGALKIAPDACYIDTSYLTIEQVCEKVISVMHLN